MLVDEKPKHCLFLGLLLSAQRFPIIVLLWAVQGCVQQEARLFLAETHMPYMASGKVESFLPHRD